MAAASSQLTEIPAALHRTTGRLFRCCLPNSLTLDAENTMLSTLKETAGDAPLLVVAVPPDDEIVRLTGGHISDIVQFYASAGVQARHAPWVERYSPENHALLDELTALLIAHLNSGGMVAVHCHSGFGRGGVVLAALLAERLDSSTDPVQQLQTINSQFLAQERPRAWLQAHIKRTKSSEWE